MKQPEVVELTKDEVEAFIDRVQNNQLCEADRTLIVKVLQFNLWLQFMLEEAKLSIDRLKKLFGFSSKKKKQPSSNEDGENSSMTNDDSSKDQSNPRNNNDGLEDCNNKDGSCDEAPAKKGHGCLGHEAYSGAETIYITHPTLSHGDPCPHVPICSGKVYSETAGTAIKMIGNSTVSAIRYLYEHLKCNLCREWFIAPLPDGVKPGKSYDESALAMMAINRYFNAVPAKRLETSQQMVGIPLPDSTQFDKMEELVNYVYLPFMEIVKFSAQGEVIHNDDTSVKILSLMKENESLGEKERRGMFTTGIVSKVGEQYIYLYFSSRNHAGENLDKVLEHRKEGREKIIQMADALSSSRTKLVETILCLCLSHGSRKFVDIDHRFPEECEVVATAIRKVYKNDAFTKKEKMSPDERLDYHKEHSAPVMETLKTWLDEQIDKKLVEPNGSLGGAINYMRNHWSGLTQFTRVVGAPLDNNICEAALKLMIRIRKNSLFFKTEFGALVASILVSLIYTTYINGENPKHYLIALQKYPQQVKRNPKLWLPWNYRNMLQEFEKPPPEMKKVS